MTRRVSLRTLAALSLLAAAVACGGGQESAERLAEAPPLRLTVPPAADFRDAVETLDLGFALRYGLPDDRRLLLEGLAAVYEARFDDAERTFAEIDRASRDPEIRALAARALSTLLEARGAWRELSGRLRDDPAFAARAGAAEIDRVFAEALEEAPAEELDFTAHPAVLATRPSRWGPPVIPVSVNGREHSFWLDTGASLSVLSSSVAEAAGVRSRGGRSGRGETSTSRTIEARPALVDELRLGSLTVRNHPVGIVADRDLELRVAGLPLVRIQGVIGWPIFHRLVVEIDYAANRTTFSRAESAPRAERNLFWLGYPMVLARAGEGRPLLLGLDTGAAATRLMDPGLAKLGRWAESTGPGFRIGAGGGESVTRRRVLDLSLTVDRLRLRFPSIGVLDQGVKAAALVQPDGKLGSDLLRHARVRIDLANGSLACR